MSHQSNIIKAEFGMLCNQGYHTSHVRGYIENDLSLICTFDNNIQLQLGCHPVAVVQYTFTHKQYIEQHN
jgi:hypothetical protein